MSQESKTFQELKEEVRNWLAESDFDEPHCSRVIALVDAADCELTTSRMVNAGLSVDLKIAMARIREVEGALRDLLRGIDVFNSRLSDKIEQPIEGDVVNQARKALTGREAQE